MQLTYFATQIYFALSQAWTEPFVDENSLTAMVRIHDGKLFVSGVFCEALASGVALENLGVTKDRHGLGEVQYYSADYGRKDCPFVMSNSIRVYRPLNGEARLVVDYGWKVDGLPRYVRLFFK
jgi:hypothetical protein